MPAAARPRAPARALPALLAGIAAHAAAGAGAGLGVPEEITVTSPNGPPLCVGTYRLAREQPNGQPAWRRTGEGAERWLFYDPRGDWAIGGGDVRATNFQSSNGWIYSPAAGGSEVPMPWQTTGWRRFDGTEHVLDPAIQVSAVIPNTVAAAVPIVETLPAPTQGMVSQTATTKEVATTITTPVTRSATTTATATTRTTTSRTATTETSTTSTTKRTTSTISSSPSTTSTTRPTTSTTATTTSTTLTTTSTSTVAALGPDEPLHCQKEATGVRKWCDASLDLDQRASALRAALTLEEKVVLFTSGVEALQKTRLNTTGKHGHGAVKATAFPRPIGIASSFNRSLFEAVGRVVGAEARGRGRHYFNDLTVTEPDINLIRDPRGGRGDLPGEDPLLAGSYGAGFIRGVQDRKDGAPLLASACLQHATWVTSASPRDLADTFLPALEASVRGGRPGCLAGCYRAEAAGAAARDMHIDLARGRWGFDGYVLNDCAPVAEVPTRRSMDGELQAGVDCSRGAITGNESVKTLAESGMVNESLLDAAVERVLRVQLSLGLLSDMAEDAAREPDARARRAVAKEAADQSLVLLKNRGGILPLSQESPPTVAVVGPFANASSEMHGGPSRAPPFMISPLAGVCLYTAPSYADGTNVTAAVELAKTTDVIVLVLGVRWDESEDPDRLGLRLPARQQELAGEVVAAAEAAGKRVVLVIMSAGPVDVTAMRDLPVPQAILWAGYPGQFGGAAIADAVFGATTPSGRLTQTWYPESFAGKVDVADASMRPDHSRGFPGRSYRFYTEKEVFPFGYGLSYAKFKSVLSLSINTVDVNDIKKSLKGLYNPHKDAALASTALVSANVEVRNDGDRAGDEVVLLFAEPPRGVGGVHGAPLRTLVAFDRVHVPAGKSVNVTLEMYPQDFSLADEAGEFKETAGRWHVWIGNDGRAGALTICVDEPKVQLRSLASERPRNLCVDEPVRNLFA